MAFYLVAHPDVPEGTLQFQPSGKDLHVRCNMKSWRSLRPVEIRELYLPDMDLFVEPDGSLTIEARS